MPRLFATFQTAFLAVLMMLTVAGEATAGIKVWSSTREAGDAFFAEFVNGDEKSARQFVLSTFDGQADPTKLVTTYRLWLDETDLHSIKLIRDDRLGEVMARETYALQKVTAGLLFVELDFIAMPDGWALFHIQIETDIGRLIPGWRSPN